MSEFFCSNENAYHLNNRNFEHIFPQKCKIILKKFWDKKNRQRKCIYMVQLYMYSGCNFLSFKSSNIYKVGIKYKSIN